MTQQFPAKTFGDPGVEFLPAEDQAIIARVDAAHLALSYDPNNPALKAEWEAAKAEFQDRRMYWRQIGELTGARRGILILNHTSSEV